MRKENKATLAIVKFLLILTLVLAFGLNLSAFSEEPTNTETITLTTYYPAPFGVYNEMQANRMAVGDTDESGGLDGADQPDADGQLYTARSIIYKPQSFLPISDAKEGELVYNDSDASLYLNVGGGGWVKQEAGEAGVGKICYIKYNDDPGSPRACPSGWTREASLEVWGYGVGTKGMQAFAVYFQPGGGCPSSWQRYDVGQAALCCKD